MIKHEEARGSLIKLKADIFEPNYEKELRMYEKFKVVFGYIAQQEKKDELLKLYRKYHRDFDDLTIKEGKDLISRIEELKIEVNENETTNK